MHRMVMPVDQRKPELADQAESRLKVPLAVLEQHLQAQLARGEHYLAANRMTVADVCVASVGSWLRPAADLLAQYPTLSKWLHGCADSAGHKQARAMK
jgi:glutathione S-transferase